MLDLVILKGLESMGILRPPHAAELPSVRPADPAALIALLDTFEEGNAEAQARDYAALKAGLDAARPGQRRLFGEGDNPQWGAIG